MNEHPDDIDPATGTTGPPVRSDRRMVPAGAFIVAVMVAMALGVLAVVAIAVDRGDEDGQVQEARLAAGRFGERFLTFEHDRLDDWKADVLALSTGGFAEEVEEVEAALRRLIDESELDATTQVTGIFIGDIDRGSVGAVLVYDRELRASSGVRTETDRYMQLRMVRIDGEWLVDNVIDIATASGGSPATPVATTTTTGPAAATDGG